MIFLVYGSPPGYVSLQVGSDICFYISTSKIWPYPTGLAGPNFASDQCNKIGLTLATIQNEAESTALKNLASNSNF